MRIQKNINDLTERYEPDDDDESDKHLEARDRRYSCLTSLPKLLYRNILPKYNRLLVRSSSSIFHVTKEIGSYYIFSFSKNTTRCNEGIACEQIHVLKHSLKNRNYISMKVVMKIQMGK